MRKILIFSVIFYSTLSLSAGSIELTSLIGSWKNQACQPAAGSQHFTAYHIQFAANGQLITYLQSYETATCDGSGGAVSQRLFGMYDIVNQSEQNGQMHYDLSFHHPRLNYLRAQRVIVQGDALQLCPGSSSGRCGYFNKVT